MLDLKTYLTLKQNQVDARLTELLAVNPESDKLSTAMHYSLMAGGKRLRPILCLAAAESVGRINNDTLNAACALEMIHTYSLIHDDLPAMDNDDLRRGKSTCHIAFDEATAILAGDALLTLAFEILLSEQGSLSPEEAHNKLTITHAIAVAAGARGMISGQMMDIDSENIELSEADLKKIHLSKTGALIKASLYTGGVLGGGSPEEVQALKIYGKHIGLAFQVADDILNVEGDPLVMGKAIGTDQALNKSTYPSVMGVDRSKAYAKTLIKNALDGLAIFDRRADPLRAIAGYIIERNQ